MIIFQSMTRGREESVERLDEGPARAEFLKTIHSCPEYGWYHDPVSLVAS